MATNRQRAIYKEITLLFPAVPFADSEVIKEEALSLSKKKLPPSIAVWLVAIAYIRHQYTDYDDLRDTGYDKESARFFVRDAINKRLSLWRATRFLTADDEA